MSDASRLQTVPASLECSKKFSPECDPGAPNLSRRHALKTLALATQLAFLSPMVALAQTSSPGSPLAAPVTSTAPLLDAPRFLQVSKALTGHASIDASFGTRLFATLCASDSSFASRAAALARQSRVKRMR